MGLHFSKNSLNALKSHNFKNYLKYLRLDVEETIDMSKRKDILTTGQVAQICKVAPRTVTKWFDSGQLRGYRIPGGRDRRIPASELVRFMKAHDIPTGALEFGQMRVLVIDSDWEMAETLSDALQSREKYEVYTADNSFDAGLIAQKFVPHVILINLMASNMDADNICKHIRSNNDLQCTKVLAIANGLNQNEASALLQKGYDGYITDHSDLNSIIKAIEEATAILY